MNRILPILAFTIIFSCAAFAAQKKDELANKEYQENKKRLQKLVDERKQKFSSYTTALENKSGIFGNQTKKDLKKVNEILAEIVLTDNKIIAELNRVLDFKIYEKVSMNYQVAGHEQKSEKLLGAIESLNLQLEEQKLKQKETARKMETYKFLTYLLAALLVIAMIMAMLKIRHRKPVASS